jgi:hypothetical protein
MAKENRNPDDIEPINRSTTDDATTTDGDFDEDDAFEDEEEEEDESGEYRFPVAAELDNERRH